MTIKPINIKQVVKRKLSGVLILICLFSGVFSKANGQASSQKGIITIPEEVILDKIRGGLLGQMIGNMNGWPYEFKFYDKYGDVQTYIPSLPNGAETDDDTDFEWVYIYNMQKTRNAFLPYSDISAYWKNSINKGIWCANRYARYLMDLGIEPPLTGSVVLNPWAEFNVSGQFLCETFGLVAPAMPQTAARIGLHYTKVAIDNEPAQSTQLFTTMISTAFIESDIDKLLDAGVEGIDPKSMFVQIIADVRKWHQHNPDNPAETHRLLHAKYELKDELTRNRNGSELNTAAIIAAILYGNGNFAETIRYSMNFGYDADCNCATVGT
ncbi:MAG: ADP-ribosylglycohydrolase family protein, partial [Prolixibacteraceae bacterium]|nr:ADP-ribosylglycohydrolase family protein [Prolixibacteraceae bacterium]